MRTSPLLSIKDMSYRYCNTDFDILKDINLTIKSGDSISISGPSGSGKSTLIALLAGLLVPTEGELIYKKKIISNLSEDKRTDWRGQKIGFVFQSYELLDHLNAIENIALPLLIRNDNNAMDKAKRAIKQVNLPDKMNALPSELSGGEQQRIAIARAIVTNPKFLLADEPTGNLDQKNADDVANLLWELNHKNKSSLIIVTHNRDLAERCSKKYTLEEGQIKSA